MSVNVGINEIVVFLHACDVLHSGSLALGFPEKSGKKLGQTVRMFTRSKNILDAFKKDIIKSVLIRDYCRLGNTQVIDTSNVTHWRAYCRYRVPTKKADRNGGRLHERRKAYAQNLPFIHLSSKSSDSSFMLRIEEQSTNAPQLQTFNPNSYGLGSMSKPVWLPVIS